MKKSEKSFSALVFFALIAFSVPCAYAESSSFLNETEVSLYNQMNFSYNSGFYPGALQFAQRIENEIPDSFFSGDALLVKGECLVRLGDSESAEDARKTLLEAIKLNSSDKEKLAASHFWLARYYEKSGDNENALLNYFESLKGKKYFYSAVLNSADIYSRIRDYENAIPLYETVLENGNEFSPEEYASSVLKISQCYNNSGFPEKTVFLYSEFSEKDFEKLGLEKTYFFGFTELAGEAYERSGNYRKAYELYCEVLESGEKSLSSDALKKAYLVSYNHRREVGEDPGKILESAQKNLSENPELLAEFWTRLATDAFSENDFRKSLGYFDEAEKNASLDLFLYALLYRAQIAAGKNPDEKSASKAEKMILESRSILNSENENLWKRESFVLLSRYAAVQKKWEDVKRYAENVSPLDEDTRFFLSLAYYSTGEYEKAENLLKNQNIELHALNLSRLGDFQDSAFVYRNIDEERGLSDEERLNYSKVLLFSGRYRESQIEAAKVKNPEGKYILALSQFNTWSWPFAEENFKSFIKNPGKSAADYVSYALFYLGYSQYRQGKTSEAYENLSRFVKNYPSHELYFNGELCAANSAVQNLKYSLASFHAENAVKAASDDIRKEEAVLLYSEILYETKKAREAVSLLEEFSGRKDGFGMKSLYQIAQIYEREKNYEKADETYKSVHERFRRDKDSFPARLSEEAMYRRGELYYNSAASDIGFYGKAVECFEEYTKAFPFGSFLDSARYFSAESLAKSGKTDRAILQFQTLIQKFPESTYIYSSEKNLVLLYRQKSDYRKAIEHAEKLISDFGEQAKSDGIENLVSDLKRLDSGKSEAIVLKENEFKKQGGLDSFEGRKAGTELVSLYSEKNVYEEDALSLAENLLSVQKKNIGKEFPFAARNAEFIGKKYRKDGRNKDSAEKYLEAAEYYKMSGESGKAAQSLYGSFEAFRAAGLSGDASETARLLRKLYPESREAKSVKVEE